MADPDLPTSGAPAPEPGARTDRLAQPVADENPPRLPFVVVGVGAAAGGLEAFRELLQALPPDSGMAFVLIEHLPPHGDSHLVELLAPHTAMPVRLVEDGLPVRPDHVYVTCPDATTTLRGGVLRLGEPLEQPGHSRPVDDFFRSLAQDQRERAIGVVLSGVGSNGAAGAQALKVVGGVCLAQDPDTARHPDMPRALIQAGYADYVLKLADMPEVLLRYARHPYASGAAADTALPLDERPLIGEVLALLRSRTGRNFSGYKKPTVLRRIQRRMGLNQAEGLREYVRLLRKSPAEAAALADDMLIHVTGFFRDGEAWEALRREVVAPLIAAREPGSRVRCWVSACSSGEEAYSLAMLLDEEAEAAGKLLDITIFATDSADATLQRARAGIYPGGIESEIAPARLERFFDRDENAYQVKRRLREMVVFAPQNILQDPPFSRMDIVCCRNLLIYLELEVQQRVLSLLHFGLRKDGALFLGTAEAVPGAGELFATIDKKWRLYRRIDGVPYSALEVEGMRWTAGSLAETPREGEPIPREVLARRARQVLLKDHAPAAVVVDADRSIVHFQGDTTPFLALPTGGPTQDLLRMARESVWSAVHAVLQQSAAHGRAASADAGAVETPLGLRQVGITATPLESGYTLVSFRVREAHAPAVPPPGAPLEPAVGMVPAVELQHVRVELQRTIEALQASNEELKASNEEFTAINEELQSTNEEQQSLSEELNTVNAQLQVKMGELEATSNDLSCVLSSTDIAVIFLDPRFRIRRFTPATRDLLELRPTDVGRPLSDLAWKFRDPDLLADARLVLEQLAPSEREIISASGRWYVRRVLPYRAGDNRIEGVVVTFVDNTARKTIEAERARLLVLAESATARARFLQELTASLADLPTPAAVARTFAKRLPEALGAGLGAVTLLSADGAEAEFFGPDRVAWLAEGPRATPRAASPLTSPAWTGQRVCLRSPDEVARALDLTESEEIWGMQALCSYPLRASPTASDAGEARLLGAFGLVFPEARGLGPEDEALLEALAHLCVQALERAQLVAQLAAERQRMEDILQQIPAGVLIADARGALTFGNREFETIFGRSFVPTTDMDAYRGWALFDPVSGEPFPLERLPMARSLTRGEVVTGEEMRLRRGDGAYRIASVNTAPLRSADGAISGVVAAFIDVTPQWEARAERAAMLAETETARQEAERATRIKDDFLAVVSHELRTPLSTVLLCSRMLSSGRLKPEDQAVALRNITRGAESQRKLIEDLLDISRMTSGQLRLHLEDCELTALLRLAVDAVLPQVEEGDLRLVVTVPDEPCLLRGDPDRLQQIVWNLLSNAIKFTPRGGEVELRLERSERSARIVIRDTGRGIPPGSLPHIFDRFRQASEDKITVRGGLGLGLAIVRELVGLHSGTVRAESAGIDQGSVFTVELPTPW